jgi:hypothetical protein
LGIFKGGLAVGNTALANCPRKPRTSHHAVSLSSRFTVFSSSTCKPVLEVVKGARVASLHWDPIPDGWRGPSISFTSHNGSGLQPCRIAPTRSLHLFPFSPILWAVCPLSADSSIRRFSFATTFTCQCFHDCQFTILPLLGAQPDIYITVRPFGPVTFLHPLPCPALAPSLSPSPLPLPP